MVNCGAWRTSGRRTGELLDARTFSTNCVSEATQLLFFLKRREGKRGSQHLDNEGKIFESKKPVLFPPLPAFGRNGANLNSSAHDQSHELDPEYDVFTKPKSGRNTSR